MRPLHLAGFGTFLLLCAAVLRTTGFATLRTHGGALNGFFVVTPAAFVVDIGAFLVRYTFIVVIIIIVIIADQDSDLVCEPDVIVVVIYRYTCQTAETSQYDACTVPVCVASTA